MELPLEKTVLELDTTELAIDEVGTGGRELKSSKRADLDVWIENFWLAFFLRVLKRLAGFCIR